MQMSIFYAKSLGHEMKTCRFNKSISNVRPRPCKRDLSVDRSVNRSVMSCFCFNFNVTDVQQDGITPFQKRFKEPFHGLIYPFGSEVQYKPSTPADVDRLKTFGAKTLSGIFLGYALNAGGIWNGDYWILDWQQVHNADHVSHIHPRRIKHKEVFPVYLNGNRFRFPEQDAFKKMYQ